MVQHWESLHQPAWQGGKGQCSWLLGAIIKGCHLLPAPTAVRALIAWTQHSRSWVSWTCYPPTALSALFFLRFSLFLSVNSFLLLNSWSNNDCRSVDLCNSDFSYHYRDGVMALSQQSESRFHSWNVSKLDPCKMTAKSFGAEITAGTTEKRVYTAWL